MLTVRRNVFVNSFWNVGGDLAAMSFAFVAIPLVIRALGIAQFGILSLALAVSSSMALFDLGLSQALTKYVADRLAAEQVTDIPGFFWSGLLLSVGLGLLAGSVLFIASPQLVRWLNVPASLTATGCTVFRLVALMVPLLLAIAGMQGFIAAFQRFDLVTAIRVPSTAVIFLCPLVVLPFSRSLVAIVAVLLLTRVVAVVAYLLCCFRLWPDVRANVNPSRHFLGSLLSFGGWLSITNLVVIVMLYCDRFLISAFFSVAEVAYYTTPYEAITKVTALPTAISRAFFPAFAEGFATSQERTKSLFNRAIPLILFSAGPLAFAALIFAPLFLNLWLGPVFAQRSSPVLRWLAVGTLINSTALMPYTLLQAAHRPDLPAKLHATEIPFYLVCEVLLIRTLGIEGAAITWSARVIIDTLVLWVMAEWVLPGTRSMAFRVAVALAGILAASAVGIWLPLTVAQKILFSVITVIAGLWAGWRFLVSQEDRRQINAWSSSLFREQITS